MPQKQLHCKISIRVFGEEKCFGPGIAELLASYTANSAFHGTRLDVRHVSEAMHLLLATAERRFGLSRAEMAARTMFMSHETYTPARGGSASAEINALRHAFGAQADRVIIANTKGNVTTIILWALWLVAPLGYFSLLVQQLFVNPMNLVSPLAGAQDVLKRIRERA